MKTINEYMDGYFEGRLSGQEELQLKSFLASDEGQSSEYDEIRAVMGFFAVGKRVAVSAGKTALPTSSGRPAWLRFAAIAAGLALLVTLGLNIHNNNNMCVKYADGQTITDKEVVMNDVDNILADLMNGGTDVETQLNDIFGK